MKKTIGALSLVLTFSGVFAHAEINGGSGCDAILASTKTQAYAFKKLEEKNGRLEAIYEVPSVGQFLHIVQDTSDGVVLSISKMTDKKDTNGVKKVSQELASVTIKQATTAELKVQVGETMFLKLRCSK